MSTRNFEEYRAEVLEQLGATAEDLRNEPSWRAKVLEALGAEYTDEDTRNFERYRLKVLENLSGGGGGGGSSDFSTAEVTIINNSSSELNSYNLAIVDSDDELVTGFGKDPNSQYTYNVVLYKGKAYISDIYKNGNPMTDGTGISVSGSIENQSNEYSVYIVITGDCTITIS